jgi:flagella basal body P-ring formation protein FlgA
MIKLIKVGTLSSIRAKRKAFGLAFICLITSSSSSFAVGDNVRLVPTTTIYPNESIKDGWIIEHEFTANFLATRGPLVQGRGEIIGKISRRTLLPGMPIPVTAVGDPKLVVNGSRVKLVYDEDGLVITTYGSALQAGGIGDFVSVRNNDSGVTITGVVQQDGSVRVSGS